MIDASQNRRIIYRERFSRMAHGTAGSTAVLLHGGPGHP